MKNLCASVQVFQFRDFLHGLVPCLDLVVSGRDSAFPVDGRCEVALVKSGGDSVHHD